MPVSAKTKTVQFRVESELFDNFSREVDLCSDASVSSVLRSAMKAFIAQAERRRERDSKDAEWAATLQSRAQATQLSQGPQKPLVGSVRQPQSLSERRNAEKAAKAAKKARREDRY